jgi:hypothetical protein
MTNKIKKVESSNSVSDWSNSDYDFKQSRDSLLNDCSAHDVAAAPFVYTERKLVTSSLTRIDLFRKILDVQGSIVECGVHRANSLFIYYHLSTILEPYNFNRKIIGFDTFNGFRSTSTVDDKRITQEDFADTDLELISKFALLHEKNKSVPHINKIELIQGDAIETIPKYATENQHLIIALLYLDFDIYAPTLCALKNLLPLVPKGGIVAFDELNSKKWQGETIALKEVLNLSGISLKKFFYDPWVSYYTVE